MEAILLIDFLACFVKIPKSMKDPTIGKTVKNYLKTFFIFDLIAGIGSVIFFVS